MPTATSTLRARVHLSQRLAAACVVLLGLAIGTAQAGIASTSGAITIVSHPTGTLNSDTLESDTTVYAWFERTLSNPGTQSLDHVGAGRVDNGTGSGTNQPAPGSATPVIADSYVVHFDQAGAGNASVQFAIITFDREIIGVWFTAAGLSGSDSQWAPTGLTYGTLTSRPYELGTNATGDRFLISADLKTITILNTYSTGSGVDQLRILVSPEPSSLALGALGVMGLGAIVLRRRRRRTPGR